jgi:hypothetical protein
MTATETLAAWALGLRIEDVPTDVVDAVSRHLGDGVGPPWPLPGTVWARRR